MGIHTALALAIDAANELAGIFEAGEDPALGADPHAELEAAERLRAAAERLQRDIAVIDTEEE